MPSPSRLDTTSEPPPAPGAVAPSKPTLLIVDDEEGPRQSLRIVFKNDYNVLVASDGLEAIMLARSHRISVVVCDIMMLGMSGVEVLKELKQIDPVIEVIMLTAFETIETARQALRHGASDYLNKPFDIPTMRAAVAHAAQKHRDAIEFRQSNQQLQDLQRVIHDQRAREEMARNPRRNLRQRAARHQQPADDHFRLRRTDQPLDAKHRACRRPATGKLAGRFEQAQRAGRPLLRNLAPLPQLFEQPDAGEGAGSASTRSSTTSRNC